MGDTLFQLKISKVLQSSMLEYCNA